MIEQQDGREGQMGRYDLSGGSAGSHQVFCRGSRMSSESEIRTAAQPTFGASLLQKVGWRGLMVVVWRATPFPLRLLAFPYGVVVYRTLLAASDSVPCLQTLHREKYNSSLWFRLLRPRYHRAHSLLEELSRRRRPR